MNNSIKKYVHLFKKLRRDYKNGGAPHKPILLLSLISLFQSGYYTNNRIEVSPEFVETFRSFWNKLVFTNHNQLFTLPFYHMKSEPFWILKPNFGYEKWVESKSTMRSIRNLRKAVSYAEINIDLVQLLKDKEFSDILKFTLLEKYFPNRNSQLLDFNTELLNASIISEDSASYQTKIIELQNSINKESFEEEVFLRSGIFKREIPKIYDNTCAVSGLRIDALSKISMIDACHITPFSETYDDSIQNGISLCPNLHRAFDRGIISISDKYTVLVKHNFVENLNSSLNISQFANKQIQLPNLSSQHPSLENLLLHRKKFDFA